MKSVTAPLCGVRAADPWARTAHDETTRSLIMRWIKNRDGFSVAGADCAVVAYVGFLKSRMQTSQLAVDQLARMDAATRPVSRQAVEPDCYSTAITMATDGWISLDE